MICFQIWFIGYLSQGDSKYTTSKFGCDLLSDLIYWIFVTRALWWNLNSCALWFAFRFDLLDICHKQQDKAQLQMLVVICFQIWFIGYLSQANLFSEQYNLCCDLLSDLIYWIFVTRPNKCSIGHIGCDLLSDLIYWIFVTSS